MNIAGTGGCLLAAIMLSATVAAAGVALLPVNSASVDTNGKSDKGDTKAAIVFYNNLDFKVDLYWIDYQGDRVLYTTIDANSSHLQPTFITHPWLLVRSGTGGTTAQGTGQSIAAFLPFTPNPVGARNADTATIGVGTDLSTSVQPTSLGFDGFSDGPVQKAYLEVGADRPGQPFTIGKAGSWLSATPSEGVTPARILIEANPAGLPPNGVYPGTIFVRAPGATTSVVSVAVVFGVGNPKPAAVAVTPQSITIMIYEGFGAGTECFTVYNAGSGTLGPLQLATETEDPVSFTLATSPRGFTVGPRNREQVCVTARTDIPGTHTGNVLIFMAGQVVATVPMVQQMRPLVFTLSPASFFISGLQPDVPGSPMPRTIVRPLTLTKHGDALATYQARGEPPWITANPPTGTLGVRTIPLSLELKFSSLSRGGYYGRLIADDGVTHLNAVSAPVVVDASGGPPKPVELGAATAKALTPGDHPSEIYRLSTNSQVERPVRITADYGNGPAFFTFARQPTEASAGGEGVKYPVRVTLSNPLPPPGTYLGEIVLTYANYVSTAKVLAIIPPGATLLSLSGVTEALARSAAAPAPAADACIPTRMIPVIRSPLDNFSQLIAWPTPLSAAVVDDCGSVDNTGSVVVSFSNGDPTLNMVSAGDGLWDSTWVGQIPNKGVELTVTAFSTDGQLTGSASILGSLATNPANPPLIFDGGAVNGASFANTTLAPGSFMSVFGSALANERLSAPSVPLPETLAGASVEIGGVKAPIFFASDGQLNAIIPYGLPVDGVLDVTVMRGDAIAVARTVRMTAAAPGVFAYGEQRGIVVGFRADGAQTLAEPTAPVTAGQVIVAYATGLGEVNPPIQAGSQTPLSPLSRTVAPVTMTIGGIEAHIDFAGLTPGSTGLYQINAVVPVGVTPGDRVPVVIRAARRSSVPTYISVR